MSTESLSAANAMPGSRGTIIVMHDQFVHANLDPLLVALPPEAEVSRYAFPDRVVPTEDLLAFGLEREFGVFLPEADAPDPDDTTAHERGWLSTEDRGYTTFVTLAKINPQNPVTGLVAHLTGLMRDVKPEGYAGAEAATTTLAFTVQKSGWIGTKWTPEHAHHGRETLIALATVALEGAGWTVVRQNPADA